MYKDSIIILAEEFDLKIEEFLNQKGLSNFKEVFKFANNEILKDLLKQTFFTNFISRSPELVRYNENSPIYDSKYEKIFYQKARQLKSLELPYRGDKEHFLLKRITDKTMDFLSYEMAHQLTNIYKEVPENVYIYNKYHNPRFIANEVQVGEDSKNGIILEKFIDGINSSKAKYSAILVPTMVMSNLQDVHSLLSIAIIDNKSKDLVKMIKIDTFSQTRENEAFSSTKSSYKIDKDKLVVVGTRISRTADLNCHMHTYNIATAFMELIKNWSFILDKIAESDNKTGLSNFLRKDLAERMHTTYYQDYEYEHKGIHSTYEFDGVKGESSKRALLDRELLSIQNMKDRWAIASGMVQQVFSEYCASERGFFDRNRLR